MGETSVGEAFLVDAVRSPVGRGRAGGALAEVHAVELLAQVLRQLVTRNDLDPGSVDDVLVGCVSQAGEQAATPGRMAWLAAGFPVHVPSATIDRRCGSSQQAVQFAAHGVIAGGYDIVIAAGVESMSRVPMGSARMGADPFGPGVTARFAPGLVSQGIAAELVAARWQLTRDELDTCAARSHRLAAETRDSGGFDREIVPIETPAGLVTGDETIRPSTTAETLASLRPAFFDDAMQQRFPEIGWHVTAGNSSQISDGAAAVLIMSEAALERTGLRPRARLAGFAQCGDDPLLMLTGPIPATHKVLQRSGLGVDDVDHFEVNEAFASVPLAWERELGADPQRVNPRGGAIALGHPLGASGARLLVTMLHALEDTGARWGLQTMCEAGGMANATVVECLGRRE